MERRLLLRVLHALRGLCEMEAAILKLVMRALILQPRVVNYYNRATESDFNYKDFEIRWDRREQAPRRLV